MSTSVQVLGISNAIVDVLGHVEEQFLVDLDAPKGSMILVEEDQAERVYTMMGPATEMSGGSVANTVAGIANLGGSTAYIGRVADDQLGRIFIHDMESLGVDVRLTPSTGGAPTARSYVLITPDGQRTMQTYLGACLELSKSDVSQETIGEAEIVLLEGYVWDTPLGQDAVEQAMNIAGEGKSSVALSLSDAGCVDRHRESFLAALASHVSIVVADDSEVMSLFQVDTLEEGLARAQSMDCIFAVTRSEQGSVIVNGHQRIVQAAYPVEQVVDTTGAGDAYAAAFLFGFVSGKTLPECADLGSFAGAAVIQQLGARLEKDLLATYPGFQA